MGSPVVDIKTVISDSLEKCVDQCTADRRTGSNCTAVTYSANKALQLTTRKRSGNCILKDQRSVRPLMIPDDSADSGSVESAYLLDV